MGLELNPGLLAPKFSPFTTINATSVANAGTRNPRFALEPGPRVTTTVGVTPAGTPPWAPPPPPTRGAQPDFSNHVGAEPSPHVPVRRRPAPRRAGPTPALGGEGSVLGGIKGEKTQHFPHRTRVVFGRKKQVRIQGEGTFKVLKAASRVNDGRQESELTDGALSWNEIKFCREIT